MSVSSIIFLLVAGAAIALFTRNVRRVIRNIDLGRDDDRSDRPAERLGVMARVALGQSKMVVRPVAGFMHILIYVGFVIINLEVLEIIIDGIFGTHRIGAFMGPLYNVLIGSFEFLAVGVLLACFVFIARRAILQLPRFKNPDLKGWPARDAMIILVVEILLMGAFLGMNAADQVAAQRGVDHYTTAGAYPISAMLQGLFAGSSDTVVVGWERGLWWFHIIGIFAFLNYLPYSKHFHIILAFPTTYFSKLAPKTEIANMERVSGEVMSMMDPSVPRMCSTSVGRVCSTPTAAPSVGAAPANARRTLPANCSVRARS